MSKRESLLWFVIYAAIMVGIVTALFTVRARTLRALNTPEARAEWQAWREAAAKQSAEGPVQRKVSKSTEPPALVLMRDHFPAMLGSSIFFATVLLVLLAWIARGAVRGSVTKHDLHQP